MLTLTPSAFSTVNPGVFKASEYVLWYAKNKLVWENKSMRIPSNRDNAYNKFIFNRGKDASSWIFLPLKLAFLEYINEDRLNEINEFISGIFLNGRGLSKPEISNMIIKLFKFYMLFDLKQVSSYLYGKLKLESFEEFKSYVYPYLLDKCSVRFDERDIDSFVFENAFAVCRETEISDTGAGKDTVDLKYESLQQPNKVLRLERGNGLEDVYIRDGKQISFYNKNVEIIEGQKTATKLLTNIWSDISWEGIANEGGVKFKKGKKPERLIKRCLELNTKPGDVILDSFLGSGTTAAVAHKMGRRWIGIELGEHCHTHCLPRLKKVIEGTDQGGISKAVNWKGGGGFKYYYLAPSLLKKDKYGNWIIDERYNADMLAAAMAKHEGFRYSPDPEIYWKQGRSTEKDYIFTTTQ
jgi:adenine-specific DNA-methyltransferase